MRIEKQAELMEEIKEKFEPRIKAVLESMRKTISENTDFHTDEIHDLSDDCYKWGFVVNRVTPGEINDNDVDIIFTIAESEEYDGSLEGITFILDITTVGGLILGGLCLYNYTKDVWVRVNDTAELEERFSIFESADVESILSLIEQD